MSKITINEVGLDWMAQRILEILAAGVDDEATTRELRQEIPEADNDDIRYRVERLEEADCVRTRPQEDGRNNSPKIVLLGLDGRMAFDDHDIDGTPPKESTEARVGALEQEVEEVREDIEDLHLAIDELGEVFARQDARLKTQQEIREEVQEVVETMESIGCSVDELEQRVTHIEKFRAASTGAVDDQGDQPDRTQDGEDEAGESEEDQDGTVGKAD